jgi:hypothetical protein
MDSIRRIVGANRVADHLEDESVPLPRIAVTLGEDPPEPAAVAVGSIAHADARQPL